MPECTADGPDRHRSSLKCERYHNPTACREGGGYQGCCSDPCLYVRPSLHGSEELGFPDIRDAFAFPHCCRCVPRSIWVRFEGQANDYGECCTDASVLAFYSHTEHDRSNPDEEAIITYYYATIFGIQVTVEIGRYGIQTAKEINRPVGCDYEESGYCAWRVYATQGYTSETVEAVIDDYVQTCVGVPDVSLGPFDGPDGCTGYISLGDYGKVKLPFVRREEVVDFLENPYSERYIDLCPTDCESGELATLTSLAVQDIAESGPETLDEYTASGTYNGKPAFVLATQKILWNGTQWARVDTGTSEENAWGPTNADCPLGVWIEDDPAEYGGERSFCVSRYDDPHSVCGDCSEVCAIVCAIGVRGGTKRDAVEFSWFETWAEGYDGWEASRGWAYTDPVTGGTQRIHLVNDGAVCQLAPDWTTASGSFTAAAIGDECARDMLVYLRDPSNRAIAVRCGHCSCWRFFCGTCRCAAPQLCAIYILDGQTSGRVILDWDETTHSWRSDEYDSVAIHLENSEAGQCQLVLYMDGEPVYFYSEDAEGNPQWTLAAQLHDCEDEAVSIPFWPLPWQTPTRLAKCIDPDIDVFSVAFEGYRGANWSNHLWLVATSALEDCKITECVDAPCRDQCGGPPESLHLTLKGRKWIEDPYYDGYWVETCTVEMELYYHEDPLGINSETGEMEWSCGYSGVYVKTDCKCPYPLPDRTKVITAGLIGGRLELSSTMPNCTAGGFDIESGELDVTDPTCDPFYYDTGWVDEDDEFSQAPELCCPNDAARGMSSIRAIITETA